MDQNGHHANGNGSPTPTEGAGAGGAVEPAKPRSPRGESGLTEIHEQRLLKRSLRERWTGAKRWNTDATAAELAQLNRDGASPSLKDLALVSVRSGLTSKDDRVRGIAVRNVLQMESQNQADELKRLPDLTFNVHTMAEDEKKARLEEILDGALARKAEGESGAQANGSE